MACLFRRKNGFFYIVSCKGSRRIWRSLRTRDLEAAQLLFVEAEESMERSRRTTLSSFFRDFLERAPLTYQDKTISIYERSFRKFLKSCGDKAIKLVVPADAERFKVVRSREISPVSVNIELKSLRAAFNESRRMQLTERNPFDGLKLVRVPYREAAHLTEDELSGLLCSINDKEFRHIIKFAVLTMMRRGEIVNLRWKDIDLARKQIHVRSTDTFIVKGGKPRAIPMSEWVSQFLKQRSQKEVFVFLSRDGKRLDGNALSRRFKRHVRRSGLNDAIHFHSLRHTGISLLINKGVPSNFVQQIAGHSSLRVTEVYTHYERKSLCDAMRAFDEPSLN